MIIFIVFFVFMAGVNDYPEIYLLELDELYPSSFLLLTVFTFEFYV